MASARTASPSKPVVAEVAVGVLKAVVPVEDAVAAPDAPSPLDTEVDDCLEMSNK
jgi:hypothetical protein